MKLKNYEIKSHPISVEGNSHYQNNNNNNMAAVEWQKFFLVAVELAWHVGTFSGHPALTAQSLTWNRWDSSVVRTDPPLRPPSRGQARST